MIICGDNAKILAGMPSDYIALTVTSPVYDDLRAYNGYSWDFEALARQLFRVTKPGGVVVWVVADATIDGSETGSSFRQALYFMECGFNLHDTMIYSKTNPVPLNHNRYEQEFEYMFIFSKGKIKTFSPLLIPTIAPNRFQRRAGAQGHAHESAFRSSGKPTISKVSKCKGNVWYYTVGAKKKGNTHPAQFPEALARDHITSWSNVGDLVFDPFLGSGTTAKMAIETGRRFAGIDISEEYCHLARRRIESAKTPLFPDAM